MRCVYVGSSVDMGKVRCDTGRSSDIVESQVADLLVQFEKKTQWLANAALSRQNGQGEGEEVGIGGMGIACLQHRELRLFYGLAAWLRNIVPLLPLLALFASKRCEGA